MAKLFPELAQEGEAVLFVYNCALEKDILWQGKLYCTTNYLCFHSVVFGKTEKLILKLKDIISIEKKMTAGVFPNAIKMTLLDGKYTFASFLKRDSSYADISAQWKSVRGSPKVLLGSSSGGKYSRRSEVRLLKGSLAAEQPYSSSSDDNCDTGSHLLHFKGPVRSMGALSDSSRSLANHVEIASAIDSLPRRPRSTTAPFDPPRPNNTVETKSTQRQRAASHLISNSASDSPLLSNDRERMFSTAPTNFSDSNSLPINASSSGQIFPGTTQSSSPPNSIFSSFQPSASVPPQSSIPCTSASPSYQLHHPHHHTHILKKPCLVNSNSNQHHQSGGSSSPFVHSFDVLNSTVSPPPGMSLLYDPTRGIVSKATNVEVEKLKKVLSSGSGGSTNSRKGPVDSVEDYGNESAADSRAASGQFGGDGGGGGSQGENNRGKGKLGGNLNNSGEDGDRDDSKATGLEEDDKKVTVGKCPCEKHDGHLLVNEVLPHKLRALVENVLKEEGSRILQDAYNACGSDGYVFWRWTVGQDGKWVSRVVEYTARFAGFMNAEPILCKETQEVLESNEECVVFQLNVESAQKFDIGGIHTSVSFTSRICLTYEGPQKLRIKVHSRTNGINNPDVEKAIVARNHNFCNSLLRSLKGADTRSSPTPQQTGANATPPPGIHPHTPSPDLVVPPGKRTSSLQSKPPPPQSDSSSSFLTSVDFWKSLVDNVVIVPAISAGKALGVLVPIEATVPTESSATLGTAVQPPLPSKKHGKKKRQQSHTDAKTAQPSSGPAPTDGNSSSLGASRLSLLRSASTNTKILGLAMLAVVFGLGLTVLNVVWMAELSDRLERTLDAVKVARERNLSLKRGGGGGGGKIVVNEGGGTIPVAVESLEEMKGRLLDHSQHLISSLPSALAKSLESVDGLQTKLRELREELLREPIVGVPVLVTNGGKSLSNEGGDR